MTASAHIALVEHQLSQLGAAFALAVSLGRKLVLPKLVCGLDKAWFPLDKSGAFAGAPDWTVPIAECPLDHVLEPQMLKPVQTVREHSFLANLRTPASLLASQASTALLAGGGGGPTAELERLRKDYADVKLLTITNLPELLFGEEGRGKRRSGTWRRAAAAASGRQ